MDYQIVTVDEDNVKARGNCRITGNVYETQPFSEVAWCEWTMTTAHIQDTGLFKLSADDREFLISGTSPQGWNNMFNVKDDES